MTHETFDQSDEETQPDQRCLRLDCHYQFICFCLFFGHVMFPHHDYEMFAIVFVFLLQHDNQDEDNFRGTLNEQCYKLDYKFY